MTLAWLLSLGVAVAAVGVGRACGATRTASWITAVALLLSAPFAASVRHAADLVASVLLVWTSWWLLIRGAHRGAGWLAAGMAAWSVALALSWLAIVTIPVILLAVAARSSRSHLRALAVAAGVSVAAGGTLAYLARMASRARSQMVDAGAAVTWLDVASVAWGWAARAENVTFAVPDAPGPTELWVALAAAALAFGGWPRWWRTGLLSAAAMAAACWFAWIAWRSDLARWIGWTAAPLAAAGVTWAGSNLTAWRRSLATGLLGAALVGASLLASARPWGGLGPRAFRDRFAAAVLPLIDRDAGVVFVSEDGLVDSAIVAWGIAPRLLQDADGLLQAEHRLALAGPAGRSHLELFGVEFVTVATVDDPVPYRLSRATRRLQCATVRADRWSLLPGLEFTGRLGLHVPAAPGGHLVVIAGDDAPLQMRATLTSGSAFPLVLERLQSGPGASAPPPDYWLDGGDIRAGPSHVIRVRIPAQPAAGMIVGLELGRRAPRVLARLEGFDDAARGRVCAAPLGPDAFWPEKASGPIEVPLGAAALFGSGWHGIEGASGDLFRWTEGDAAVLIPSARQGPVRVVVRAAPAADPGDGGPTLTLHVNGLAEPPRVMSGGVSRYEWLVPRRRWVIGTNELRFSVSRSVRPADRGGPDTRVLGLRVHELMLAPE